MRHIGKRQISPAVAVDLQGLTSLVSDMTKRPTLARRQGWGA
jgi:hypothetical protein